MKIITHSNLGVEIKISRVFKASAEDVWNAWTKPEYLKSWWGPKGFTVPFYSVNLKDEGKYLYCLQSPGGENIWGTGTYREIIPFRLIRATDSFSDKYGNIVPSSFYGINADFPLSMEITITFQENDDFTEMALKHSPIPGEKAAENTAAAWSESFDKLRCFLKKKNRYTNKNVHIPGYEFS